MEKAIGTVLEINGDMAKVKIDRKSMCGDNCASCGNICGVKDTILSVSNSICAKQNDKVLVSIPTTKGIVAMLITYGVPLMYALFLMIVMAAGVAESLGAILLISGTVLWFLTLWILEKKGIFFTMFKAEIIEILS